MGKCVHNYIFYKESQPSTQPKWLLISTNESPKSILFGFECSLLLFFLVPHKYIGIILSETTHFIHSVFMMINITIAVRTFIFFLKSFLHSLYKTFTHCGSFYKHKQCVYSCTYWAAIKIYKAMRLFEKVFLNSVWSFELFLLLLLLFEFVVVVVVVIVVFNFSFILFIHFSFDILPWQYEIK